MFASTFVAVELMKVNLAKLYVCFFAALAICTVLCNLPVITKSFTSAYARIRSNGRSLGEYVDGPRAVVASNVGPNDRLCFISNGNEREKSAETAVIQAISWHVMPNPLDVVTYGSVGKAVESYIPFATVLSPSRNSEVSTLLSLPSSPFEKIGEKGGRTWWKKSTAEIREKPADSGGSVKRVVIWRIEAIGLVPILIISVTGYYFGGFVGILTAAMCFSVLIMIGAAINLPPVCPIIETIVSCIIPYFTCHAGRRTVKSNLALFVAFAVFVLFALLALAHTFTTPYGLAITGGRAKLWYELARNAGGLIRSGFFSCSTWKIFEPAYPPGCTAITFGLLPYCRGMWRVVDTADLDACS